ncbi:glutamate formimidoyltransferase [Myxococcota bacterium]|nr:glutamate formimidoyltransferase [Myxococcota bacterium]
MTALVECVPNFSEGRDRAVLDAIAGAISAVEGVQLLDVDPGAATHRTVFTFVGSPEVVLEAAFRAIRVASERIDMGRHKGEHPRMGATDVCPFVPVAGVTLEECAELARRLGRRVGDELRIPVFLYEAAASRPGRRSLADIRKGEYEGLAEKMRDPEWAPDFGPAEFNPRSGATVIGARPFLIAYNVNLNTRSVALANEVARDVREQGRLKRDPLGQKVLDEAGDAVREPGLLPTVRAVGWYIAEYHRAQVSINLTDPEVAGMHTAFDACAASAERRGLRATGSELVGLVPKRALVEAGRHYLARQGAPRGLPEARVIEAAVQSLGLAELSPFDPKRKVVEYRVVPEGRLVSMSVRDFADETSSDSPAPGGGSIAALVGGLAAALASMVANLTVGRKGHEAAWADMDRAGVAAQGHKEALLAAVDEDTAAFDRVLAARRLPKRTEEERAIRERAVGEANRGAVAVPLSVLRRAPALVDLVADVARRGNPNALSDAAVAAACAATCAEGAALNVLTNLSSLGADPEFVRETRAEVSETLDRVVQASANVRAMVRASLEEALDAIPRGK